MTEPQRPHDEMAGLIREHRAEHPRAPFMTRKGDVAPNGCTTCLHYLDQLVTLYAEAEQTGGVYGLLTGELPKNSGPPPHIHNKDDEAFLVMSGHVHFWVGDQFFDAPAGTFVFLPRNVVHWFQAVSDEPSTVVCIVTPGGHEQMFRMAGEQTRETTMPPPMTEFPFEKIAAAAAAVDVELVPHHAGWLEKQMGGRPPE
jgi:quercetin dioxygenase-like cupin family protein